MKNALRDVIPAAAFAAGVALLCYGLALVYLPLGPVAGGIALAAGAYEYERKRARHAQ